MKNIKKLTAYVLASSLLLSNIATMPVFAEEESTNLTKQTKETTNEGIKDKPYSNVPAIDVSSLKVDKKNLSYNDSFTVTINAPEDRSNIAVLGISFKSPITSRETTYFLTYNAASNQYKTTRTIDNPYIENGLWTVGRLFIYTNDKDDNNRNIQVDIDCSAYDLSNASFNVNNDNVDYTEPTFDQDSLMVEKKCIKAGEDVNGSFKAYDDNSGVGGAYVIYTSELTSENYFSYADYNPLTDRYEFHIRTSEDTTPGKYIIHNIRMVDNAGNFVEITPDKYDLSNASYTVIND